MKTVLVAGGAGFIGSNLCHHLIHQGYEVISVDNLMTGCLDNDENKITFRGVYNPVKNELMSY